MGSGAILAVALGGGAETGATQLGGCCGGTSFAARVDGWTIKQSRHPDALPTTRQILQHARSS